MERLLNAKKFMAGRMERIKGSIFVIAGRSAEIDRKWMVFYDDRTNPQKRRRIGNV